MTRRYLTDSELKRRVAFATTAILERGRVVHMATCAVCKAKFLAPSMTQINTWKGNHREHHRYVEKEADVV